MAGIQMDNKGNEFVASMFGFPFFEDYDKFNSIQDIEKWGHEEYPNKQFKVNPLAEQEFHKDYKNPERAPQLWLIQRDDSVEVVTRRQYNKLRN